MWLRNITFNQNDWHKNWTIFSALFTNNTILKMQKFVRSVFFEKNCNICKQSSENCPVNLSNRSSNYVITSSTKDDLNLQWNSWHLYQSLCLHFWWVKVLWHSNVWKQSCQIEWLTGWISAFKVVLKHFVDKFLKLWELENFCALRFSVHLLGESKKRNVQNFSISQCFKFLNAAVNHSSWQLFFRSERTVTQ